MKSGKLTKAFYLQLGKVLPPFRSTDLTFLNSFNKQLATEVKAALTTCQEDESIWDIVLTGAGKAFCTGQELQEITGDDAPSLSPFSQKLSIRLCY